MATIFFRHFGGGAEEKKELPHPMQIKKGDAIQDITVIKFMYINELSSDFFSDHDHLTMVVLAELSTKEKAILPCFS